MSSAYGPQALASSAYTGRAPRSLAERGWAHTDTIQPMQLPERESRVLGWLLRLIIIITGH